jgi:FkbM family methyltransferase
MAFTSWHPCQCIGDPPSRNFSKSGEEGIALATPCLFALNGTTMRLADLPDYFRLRRHLRDPAAFLRLRKSPPAAPFLDLRLRDGGELRIRPATQDRHIFHRVFGRDEYRVGKIPPRSLGTVIDVGAHAGIFAVRAAALAARVICLEPDPGNFPLLRHNTSRFPGIQAFPRAVAGRGGPAVYYPAPDPSAGTLFPVTGSPPPGGPAGGAGIPVECLTLAEVFQDHRIARCDILKLDCEGAEHGILRSIPPELWARIDRIRLEYHPSGQGPAPERRRPASDVLLALLAAAGYECRLFPRRYKAHSGLLIAWRCGLRPR